MMSSAEVRKLPLSQKLAYSIGHVLNDLTASMWFSYIIIYFHQVKNFNNSLSGNLVLIGQISDAICTPFVGLESDRTKGFCKMGKKKSWHLIGTICVICSFPFLFNECITCAHAPDWAQFIYYAPFVIIFQFGWASTQISHLSLIPNLTHDEGQRVELNGMRYAWTVLSNLIVYGIAWLLFDLNKSSSDKVETMLDHSDVLKFRNLVFIAVGIGAVFSLVFHIGVKEPRSDGDSPPEGKEALLSDSEAYGTIERSMMKEFKMTWKCWLKEHQFYQVALLYMCTRLVVNVSQVYLPMFITETLLLEKDSIAIIPLVVYVSGFFTSLLMRPLNALVGRKASFFTGQLIATGAFVWIYFVPKKSMMVYGIAVLIGMGGTTMLVTVLAMTADLIKSNVESGAFVYGAMSFTDKLSNGIAITVIQQLHPCESCCPKCVGYYREVLAFVPGGVLAISFIGLLIILPQKIGTRRKKGAVLTPVLSQNGSSVRPINSSDTESDEDEYKPLMTHSRTHTRTYSLLSERG